MNKTTLFILALMVVQPAMATEQHEVVLTLQSRDMYRIEGKDITLKTYNCTEVANGTPATLLINDMNTSIITFDTGKSCRVTNINNGKGESLD